MRITLNLGCVKMASYDSIQKRALIDYMRRHNDRPLTIDEIISGLTAEAHTGNYIVPGKSTVYRLMTKLVESGSVKRFVRGNSRQFLYQITDGDKCRLHFHLKCDICGRLYHMDEEISHSIAEIVGQKNGFTIDRDETTFFGHCRKCKKPDINV